jgi:inosine-uridine nucleoside N-ribohydrolase
VTIPFEHRSAGKQHGRGELSILTLQIFPHTRRPALYHRHSCNQQCCFSNSESTDIIDRIIVVWLGGHVLNWTDTREFNPKQDIGGSQVLFDSGAPIVLVPCMGVSSHLHTTVPEIERYVEPHGDIGAFLAKRFKKHSDRHKGWSEEIWDMVTVAWVLNEEWAPSYLVSSPIVTEQATWSFDHSRHLIRYVHQINRYAIMQDVFQKLEAFAGN